ncbi:hypothetical protein HPQ64_11560 [Rhizobiales bacterium]|uniref:hypothetical protein n=1 Tax=Hongsoonwoonella zoysiae TaxID=2821844 RepID=UPI0015602636|nr:hypothetical protein [Hongsoonwoonella zoysiae]NRG18326.1 hypothetical protein [Hongsoonwoonella zoysiae]
MPSLMNALLVIFSICISIAAAEIFIRYFIVGEPRIFEVSRLLGWDLQKELSVTRKKATRNWEVYTDASAYRVDASGNPPENCTGRDIVFLGDSFTFGEGVNIEERFDFLSEKLRTRSLNFGVMGYSPLQSFLKFQEFLKKGNCKNLQHQILLSSPNDVVDSQKHLNHYRYKPYLSNGDVILLNNLEVFHGHLRDRSYLYYLFVRALALSDNMPGDPLDLGKFEDELVYIAEHSTEWQNTYVFQGYTGTLREKVKNSQFCAEHDCKFYDRNPQRNPDYFLKGDSHWNAKGHRAYSAFIAETIGGNSNLAKR